MVSRHVRALADYRTRLIDRLSNLDPNLAAGVRDIKLDWYTIKNEVPQGADTEETSDTTQVYIYEEIGGSFGVSAEEFVKDLNAITTPKINVRINSPGGSLFDGIAIYNALVAHPSHIITQVDALAASAASIVALGGNEVVTMVGAQWMIHDAIGTEMGNARDMKAMSTFLDRQSDNIASIYANKAGGEVADWRAKMLAETWCFAAEAVELGLSDRVYSPPKVEEPDDDSDMMEEAEEEMTNSAPALDVEALMGYRHRLTNRGYKYNGRRKAPEPISRTKNVLSFATKLGV